MIKKDRKNHNVRMKFNVYMLACSKFNYKDEVKRVIITSGVRVGNE